MKTLAIIAAVLLAAQSQAGDVRRPAAAPSVVAGRPNPRLQTHVGFVSRPEWVRLPSPKDYRRYAPAVVTRDGVSGKVTLLCKVSAYGNLRSCVVLSETPAGKGLGAAALNLAQMHQLRPRDAQGRSFDGAFVHVPITFGAPKLGLVH